MGYEIRMLVASAPVAQDERTGAFFDEEDGAWVYVEADLWLGKMSYDGAYQDLLNETKGREKRRYFYYAHDNPPEVEDYRVTHDPYDDRLLRLEPEAVLEALRKDAKEWSDSNILYAAAAMLEKFIERGPRYGSQNELIVLHYGY